MARLLPSYHVIVIWLTLLTFASSTRGLTLVEDGKPKATIVVAAAAVNADEKDEVHHKVRIAAEDFQKYVRLISGATLPIASDGQETAGPRGHDP